MKEGSFLYFSFILPKGLLGEQHARVWILGDPLFFEATENEAAVMAILQEKPLNQQTYPTPFHIPRRPSLKWESI
jgi:hypothetical protein